MKTETIIAISNKGKQNEDTAQEDCDIPENLQEASELVGGEEEVFKRFLAAYKVELQNKIRKPAPRKVAYVLDVFKNLLPLVDSRTISMEQAKEASKYFGPWVIPEGGNAVDGSVEG